MQLTTRSLALLLLTALPLALLAVTPLAAGAVTAWLALVGVLLVIDMRLTPGPDAWTLERQHDDRLSLADWNRVVVTIRLRAGPRPLPLWLRDEAPESFRIEDRDRVLTGRARPGEPLTLTYHIYPPRRGDYQFGDLHLRWESALGLLRRQARFPAAEPVKVYPNLAAVRRYDLLLRQNRLWEMGLRNARSFGAGSEFERLRDYQSDDEYRRINWKATARRGAPIVVEYETERSQHLLALLDVGRLMRSPVGDVARLDYAINSVLLLAFVAARYGDKLGVLTFADRPQAWLAPRGGKRQFLQVLELLYRVEAQPIEPNYVAAVNALMSRKPRRALALVFTDLTGSVGADALVSQMLRLRRQHLPLLVTISDPTVRDLARAPVVDSQSLHERTVASRLLDERQAVLTTLRAQGVLTLDVAADQLSVSVIDKYFELKARVMI